MKTFRLAQSPTLLAMTGALLAGCLQLPPITQTAPSKEDITEILASSPEKWTLEQCEAVIQNFTGFNKAGYDQKLSDYSVRTVDVFIKATFLNREVISARVRKDAINKRLPVAEFRRRLKVELEDYTNFKLDLDSGEILPKRAQGDSLLQEYSFLVYFENISLPHRNIEIYLAQEGFFLEDTNGQFTRATDFWGTEISENFLLVTDLKGTITFSALTDSGEELVLNKNNITSFRLVCNGLQTKPIVVKW